MADSRVSNPLVEQFRRGGVPRELRLMAAQGALQLVLHALSWGAAAVLEAKANEEDAAVRS